MADGACHQASPQVCQGQPGSPPTCSYKATVTGQTTFNLEGIWAGAGCSGKQTTAPVAVPLNSCIQSPPSSVQKFVLASPQQVNQLLFPSATPPPPPPSGQGSCCFFSGGATCANHPVAMCPDVPACATEPECTGACSGHPLKSTWCPGVTPSPPPPPPMPACVPVLKGQVAPVPGKFQPGGQCPGSCDGGQPIGVGTTASADGSFCAAAGTPGPPLPTPAPPTACAGQPVALFNWTVGGQCLDAPAGVCAGWSTTGDGCSYKISLGGSSVTAFLWGHPAQAGCVGTPNVIDGPIALNTCSIAHDRGGSNGTATVQMTMSGPQTVAEAVYASSPPGPPPSAGCTGTPEATVKWMADGTFHQAAENVCTGQPGSPPTCSYNATVAAGQATFTLAIWEGTGCAGKQTMAPTTLPLDVCTPAPPSSQCAPPPRHQAGDRNHDLTENYVAFW
jgi:hypothetical protein